MSNHSNVESKIAEKKEKKKKYNKTARAKKKINKKIIKKKLPAGLQWLNDHNIAWFPLKLTIDGKRKFPSRQTAGNGRPPNEGWKKRQSKTGKWGYWGLSTDFEDLPKHQIKLRQKAWNTPGFNHIAIDTRSISQIDYDSPVFDDRLQVLKDNTPYFKSVTKPYGLHAFVTLGDIEKDKYAEQGVGYYIDDKISYEAEAGRKIDVLCKGWSYAPRDLTIINADNDIQRIDKPDEWFVHKKTVDDKSTKKHLEDKLNKTFRNYTNNLSQTHKMTQAEVTKWCDYANIVSDEEWKGYSTWIKLLWSAKNCGMEFNDFLTITRDKPGFEGEEDVKIKWDSSKTRENNPEGHFLMWNYLFERAYYSNQNMKLELDRRYGNKESFNRFEFHNIAQRYRQQIKDIDGNSASRETKIEQDIANLYEEKDMEDDTEERKKIMGLIREKRQQLKKIKRGEFDDELIKICQECYQECREYFQLFHFKVKYPKAAFVIIDRNNIHIYESVNDFKMLYQNLLIPDCTRKNGETLFFDKWIRDIFITTYSEVDFVPPPCEARPSIYNLWKGLRCDREFKEEFDNQKVIKGSYKKFIDHLEMLVGDQRKRDMVHCPHGEWVTGKYSPLEFALRFIAQMIQEPGKLPGVCLLFSSEQGTGKSIFWEMFGKYFLGEEYLLSTARIDDIVGRFTAVNQKLIVIMDEANSADREYGQCKLKNTITQETIQWEAKSKQTIPIKNLMRLIMLVNPSGEDPINIELTDRRYVVFNCSNEILNRTSEEKDKYFNDLANAFKDKEARRAFYHYLMNIDLTGFHAQNDRPITQAYINIKRTNVPQYYYFLQGLCEYNREYLDQPEDWNEEEKGSWWDELEKRKKDPTRECNADQEYEETEFFELYQKFMKQRNNKIKRNQNQLIGAIKAVAKRWAMFNAINLENENISLKPINIRRALETMKGVM
tara:strand:- start:639 stop:3461 length:2823 start_codon:yes stop_codon:yes gene_type:complete